MSISTGCSWTSLASTEHGRRVLSVISARCDELSAIFRSPDATQRARLDAYIEYQALQETPRVLQLRLSVLERAASHSACSGPVSCPTETVTALPPPSTAALSAEAHDEEAHYWNRLIRHDLLTDVFAHRRSLVALWRAQHDSREAFLPVLREERDFRQRVERQRDIDRMAALRNRNVSEYLRLLQDEKQGRLQQIVEKTDGYIRRLLAGVGHGDAGFIDQFDDIGDAYYAAAHRFDRPVEPPTDFGRNLPGGVVGTLKTYQLEGLRWLVSLHRARLGGVLADDMGLGKTVQTIALLAWIRENEGAPGPHIVVCPLSTVGSWASHFAQWAPQFRVVQYCHKKDHRRAALHQMREEGFDVVLTTYDFIRRDARVLGQWNYHYCIVDEAHSLKNSAGRASTLLRTCIQSANRLFLTGTPVQNNLDELWALLRLVLPEVFAEGAPREQRDDHDADDDLEGGHESFLSWFTSLGSLSSFGHDVDLNDEERMLVLLRLQSVLRPFILRRDKETLRAELPTKQEVHVACPLSPWQLHLYHTVSVSQSAAVLAGGAPRQRALRNAVMQLRKTVNHPWLMEERPGDAVADAVAAGRSAWLWRASGKFTTLRGILRKLIHVGHRILIFSQFKETLNLLSHLMVQMGISAVLIDGTVPQEEREAAIESFNSPNSPHDVFLLSTRAAGLGLNLQTADTVIIFDSDWNPTRDLQAQDRAFRIGQQRDVRVLRLLTQTGVEQRIIDVATRKQDLSTLIMDAGGFDSGKRDMTAGDRRLVIQELLLDAQDRERIREMASRDLPTGETLNAIIARTDDEIRIFNEMDAQLDAEWAATAAATSAVVVAEDGNTVPEEPLLPYVPPEVLELQAETDAAAAARLADGGAASGRRVRAVIADADFDGSDDGSDLGTATATATGEGEGGEGVVRSGAQRTWEFSGAQWDLARTWSAVLGYRSGCVPYYMRQDLGDNVDENLVVPVDEDAAPKYYFYTTPEDETVLALAATHFRRQLPPASPADAAFCAAAGRVVRAADAAATNASLDSLRRPNGRAVRGDDVGVATDLATIAARIRRRAYSSGGAPSLVLLCQDMHAVADAAAEAGAEDVAALIQAQVEAEFGPGGWAGVCGPLPEYTPMSLSEFYSTEVLPVFMAMRDGLPPPTIREILLDDGKSLWRVVRHADAAARRRLAPRKGAAKNDEEED